MMHKCFLDRDKEGVSEVVAVILMVGATVIIAALVFLMSINITGGMGKGPVFVSATTGNNMGDCFVTIQGTSKPLPCQDITAQYINSNGVTVESATLDQIYYTENTNMTYRDTNHNAMLDVGDQILINNTLGSGGGKLVLISTSSNNIVLGVNV